MTAVWQDLRKAVREAHRLGAQFRIVGADIEVDGELPATVRDRLPPELLREYFGAVRTDNVAAAFLDLLRVEAVLVTDQTGADAAMQELTGLDPIAIDIETAPPNDRPAPVRINIDGSIAAHQAEPSDHGLDPHRAHIATAQLYGGGDHVLSSVGKRSIF